MMSIIFLQGGGLSKRQFDQVKVDRHGFTSALRSFAGRVGALFGPTS